ncbi:alpha-1,2-fucosyltransferase [Carnobacterium mobile]|uniref:alpha-1,2-fucosyltransferase n=1 Tax=Carnobacterium mobile TaxID=2750 RepID=UPI00186650A8|nr:alpha-1,2-fucosyltransferase [Carnobacterium mobile]
MIFVDIKGNLGNQLFIYACARKIQKETGQTICLNTYYLKKYYKDYTFSLSDLKLNDNVVIEENKSLPWFMNVNSFFSKAIIKTTSKFNGINQLISNFVFYLYSKFGVYIWLNTTYKKLPIKKRKNYYLSGFWQSDKYFEDIRENLLEELLPREKPLNKNHEFINLINKTESICVTIRRGDYITNEKVKKTHFICDEAFFVEGVEKLKNDLENPVVFCFSDDIEWAKENIHFDCPTYYECGNDPVWEKLRLMSLCKNFVISNSSFSWWAQYLSKSENKIVYAPSVWYADGTKADIFQDNWKYINV